MFEYYRRHIKHGHRGLVHALAIGLLCVLGTGAQAQITYTGSGNGNINAVCAGSTGTFLISTTDECADPTDFTAFPTSVQIGPSGAATFFQTSDGSVQFNGASTTFANQSTFNGGFVVNGGVTVSMGGNRIENVGTPTSGTDAANKDYVDTQNATQQTQINSNTTRITNAEAVNASQQTQINSNTTRITNVEAVNGAQQTEIADLQTDVAALNDTAGGLQSQIDQLNSKDKDLAEGIAIALSLDKPYLHSGQTFGVNVGWGGFDGQNAVGLTAAGIIDRGAFGPNSTTTLHGGVAAGTGSGQIGGRAGVSFGW
jgi:hypothetical protein